MRILCVSDQIDPIVYSTAIRERFRDVELVLSAGDLPMEYLSFIVSSLNKPLLFVFGNHNLNELSFYRPAAGQRLDRSLRWPFAGLEGNSGAILGLGGSIRYNGGLNQYTNAQMMFHILLLLPKLLWNKVRYGRFVDIVLTHAPPAGIHDRSDPCHRGFRSFLWLMRVFRPRFLVHGHVHLYDLNSLRVSRYESTTVVNAFSHHVLEWDSST